MPQVVIDLPACQGDGHAPGEGDDDNGGEAHDGDEDKEDGFFDLFSADGGAPAVLPSAVVLDGSHFFQRFVPLQGLRRFPAPQVGAGRALLLTQNKYDSPALYAAAMNMGLVVLPFVLLTSLALLYAILVLTDHERLEQADRLASLRESYYQNLRREERQIRTLRHDLRNHLTVVQGLLERGETERAAGYLGEIASSPAMGGRRTFCENETANVVLSAKAEAMDQAGLTGDFAVSLPRELPLADMDLCALLGNALDNAIEAAVQAEDRRITVRCRVEKGLFMLRVENAVDGELRPDLATTKANKRAHGFGLAGMREIAERCGGSLETRAGAGRFELVACIPLNGG